MLYAKDFMCKDLYITSPPAGIPQMAMLVCIVLNKDLLVKIVSDKATSIIKGKFVRLLTRRLFIPQKEKE